MDELFHNCALLAYVEVATEMKTENPDANEVKRREYKYYEDELAKKNCEGLNGDKI